jgi:hypothetical protein
MAAAAKPGPARAGAFATLVLALAVPLAAQAAESQQLVALVLDTSGSIGPRDEALRRRLAEGVMRALPAGSEVAVFAFADQPQMVLKRTSDREEVASAVARLRRSGRYTALYDAVFDASRYLADEAAERKGILLVTDGVDENSAVNLEDALAVAREQAIPVVAIGIGKVQERVLRRIAKLTGGDYFPARAKPAVVAERIGAAAEHLAVRGPSRAVAPARTAEVVRDHAAGPAPAAVPAPPAAASRPEARAPESSPHVTAPAPWLIAVPVAAILLLAAVIGLVAVSRRKASASAPTADTAPLPRRAAAAPPPPAYPEDDEDLEVLREGGGSTLVLTLLPLLRVVKGPAAGKMFEVPGDKPITIGRAKENDIPIDDRAISNRHCRIRPGEGGLFEIVDLKSTNGTFVNRRRVSRQPLAPGDVIKIGETSIEFRMDHLKDE